MKYIMGLDIGISSIGWAIINDEKKRIEDLGVRIFPSGERPKDGGPLNENRRIARGQRVRLSRRRVRMRKIKELLVNNKLVTEEELEKLYTKNAQEKDVWLLRIEGLDRKLEDKEWARVLTTLAKRRGYKSNRKDSKSEKDESGKVLKAIGLNKAIMENKNYRTVGEMLVKEAYFDVENTSKNSANSEINVNFKNNIPLRNKQDNYTHSVLREMIEDEVKTLFEAQRKFGNDKASEEFEKDYLEVFNYQKPFMTKKLMEKMIGKCTFETDEPRASKNSWTFERFMLLNKINNLSFYAGKDKYTLSDEQRNQLINMAYEQKEVKYSQIRKLFELSPNIKFSGLDYSQKKKAKKGKDASEEKEIENNDKDENYIKEAEKTTFVKLVGYHTLKDCFKQNDKLDYWETLKNNTEKLDEIAEVLSKSKTENEIKRELKHIGIEDEIAEILKEISFDKYGHLSYKAMKKINPYLEEGKTYDKACELCGYDFKNEGGTLQKKLPRISREYGINPVMYRSVTQTRKVINALIDKYGSPYEINIEVGRDLTKNREERNRIQKMQNERQSENEKIKEDIKEQCNRENPKPVDILKYRLWKEQHEKSAYSLKPILLNQLFEDNYVQIDHILPFSKSFDDSYNNKVLVLAKENQDKRNNIPREYIRNEEEWDKFEAWVNATYKYNPRKRENLLKEEFTEEDAEKWRERNMVDTKFICRYLANFIKNNLIFENYGEKDNRIKVKMISGAVTTALRHYWGIQNKDRETDLHHAEDAVILACAENKYIKKIQDYSKNKELYTYQQKEKYKKLENGEYVNKETGEIVGKYIEHDTSKDQGPWDNFRNELEARMSKNPRYDIEHGNFTNYNDVDLNAIKPIFVSRMPNRKVKGQAHEETIYSNRGNGIVVIKKFLNNLTAEDIKSVCTKEDFKELYLSDKSTYDAIYERMKEFDFKADKAFPNDFVLRKKSKKGSGQVVKSIKIPSKMNSGVKVQGGIAANGGMVRVDVFEKNGKNYLVPIYVADVINGKLPNKVIRANTPKEQWPEIDETYNFKFSLYSNDLVCIKKKGEKEIIAYYNSTHSGTGAINLESSDGNTSYGGIGVQSLEIFEKYQVDLLGNYYKVKKEKRKGGIKN